MLLGILVLLLLGTGWWLGWFSGARGNGSSPTTKVDVQGVVTLDGQPLEEASIHLLPTEQNGGTLTAGRITNGKFVLVGPRAVVPGSYRVEIRSKGQTRRTLPQAIGHPEEMAVETSEGVAPRFNSASELTVVVGSGSTTMNFEVFGE